MLYFLDPEDDSLMHKVAHFQVHSIAHGFCGRSVLFETNQFWTWVPGGYRLCQSCAGLV